MHTAWLYYCQCRRAHYENLSASRCPEQTRDGAIGARCDTNHWIMSSSE